MPERYVLVSPWMSMTASGTVRVYRTTALPGGRHRDDRRSAWRRLAAGARTRSPDVDAFRTVALRILGCNRADDREAAASRRPRRRIRPIDDHAVAEDGGQHLVLHDLRDDAPIEGRRIDLSPVLVDDVEVQPIPDDDDVLDRADGVRIVAASAHHTSQLIAHQ